MTRDFEGLSDIVERLRDRLSVTPASIGYSDPGVELDVDLLHAVNEIERLRADNERLRLSAEGWEAAWKEEHGWGVEGSDLDFNGNLIVRRRDASSSA